MNQFPFYLLELIVQQKFQVECKKAQPKETVTPATQMQLQKRLLLSGLGLRMPINSGFPGMDTTRVVGAAGQAMNGVSMNGVPNLAALQAQAQLSQNAAVALQAQTAAASSGKLFATYPPSFHALR